MVTITIPRRCDIHKNTPLELTIRATIREVEKMGADARLTDAVVYLSDAFDSLADFNDDQPRRDKPDHYRRAWSDLMLFVKARIKDHPDKMTACGFAIVAGKMGIIEDEIKGGP